MGSDAEADLLARCRRGEAGAWDDLFDQHYAAAQQALRNGDLATYQKEIDTVGQILIQLQTMLGTPAPSGQ